MSNDPRDNGELSPEAAAATFCAQNTATLYCRRCGATLGTTSALTLTLGGVVINQRVQLSCMVCGAVRTWRPLLPPLT